MDKFKLLEEKYKKIFSLSLTYDLKNIINIDDIELIYDNIILFLYSQIVNDILVLENSSYSLFIGFCYEYHYKNKKLEEKYYLIAAKQNNSYAMFRLGAYYFRDGKILFKCNKFFNELK